MSVGLYIRAGKDELLLLFALLTCAMLEIEPAAEWVLVWAGVAGVELGIMRFDDDQRKSRRFAE